MYVSINATLEFGTLIAMGLLVPSMTGKDMNCSYVEMWLLCLATLQRASRWVLFDENFWPFNLDGLGDVNRHRQGAKNSPKILPRPASNFFLMANEFRNNIFLCFEVTDSKSPWIPPAFNYSESDRRASWSDGMFQPYRKVPFGFTTSLSITIGKSKIKNFNCSLSSCKLQTGRID